MPNEKTTRKGQLINSRYSWDEMLEEFRGLGGVADNVQQRVGELGYGIFPIDPGKPVAIEIPANLLLDPDHLILDGDDLVVDPSAGVSPDICSFIARYQRHFSWGAQGRDSVEAAELSLKSLPEPLLRRLKDVRLLDLDSRHHGSWKEVLRSRFLMTRAVTYHKRMFIMPVIELLNHSPTGRHFAMNDGIQVHGTFETEVLISYGAFIDPLQCFFNYGFVSEELFAFSLPTQLALGSGPTLQIGRMIFEFDESGNGTPKLSLEGSRIVLSHLRLGMHDAPRMQRTLLRKRLPDLSPLLVDELFERVRSSNLVTLCELLEMTDECVIPAVRDFRKAVIFQIKALSYCFGVREDLTRV